MYSVYTFTTWEGEGVENPEAQKLVDFLLDQAYSLRDRMSLVSSSRLRETGWKFKGDELVGELEQ